MSIYVWKDIPGGIFWNQADGLISISSDGITWYTIADKNLGATTVRNNGDSLTQANVGKMYQWGNNYGFNYSTSQNYSTSALTITGYGPNNYLNNSTLRTLASGESTATWKYSPGNFVACADLWGGRTNTYPARKGPCNTGWHIPKRIEIETLETMLKSIYNDSNYDNIKTIVKNHLKMPVAGYLLGYNTSTIKIEGPGDYGYYWTSDLYDGFNPNAYTMDFYSIYTVSYLSGIDSLFNALPIRPFKNIPVQPTTDWTIIYQPS